MKAETAKKTVRSISFENQLLRAGVGGCLLVTAVMGYALATRSETVILVPPFTHETISFTEGRANEDYYRQWAWSTAMLLGNLDPSNAEFVRAELQRMATTTLYQRLSEQLTGELASIMRDNAVVTFTPMRIVFDPELDLYFVTGRQQSGGAGARAKSAKTMTYEMKFELDRLRIYLDDISVYPGEPMTADVRESRLAEIALKNERAAGIDALQEAKN